MNFLLPVHEKIVEKAKTSSLFCPNNDLGLCTYLFEYARARHNKEVLGVAEDFLEKICGVLPDRISSLSVVGREEVVLTLDYLIDEKYVEGDINDVLHDLDIVIFKQITLNDGYSQNEENLLFSLYYCYIRLKKQVKGSDEEFIFQELIVCMFNRLVRFFDGDFFEEPFFSSLERYKLPQFIYITGKLISLDFYNYRIEEVLRERSFQILSRLPLLHSHRLYLLCSMVAAKESMHTEIWDESMKILYRNIDVERIVRKELSGSNLYMTEGLAGIIFLLLFLEKRSYKLLFTPELIYQKIMGSDVWQELKWEKESLNLKDGMAGLLLAVQVLKNKMREEDENKF